jgi:hypothetical protein
MVSSPHHEVKDDDDDDDDEKEDVGVMYHPTPHTLALLIACFHILVLSYCSLIRTV